MTPKRNVVFKLRFKKQYLLLVGLEINLFLFYVSFCTLLVHAWIQVACSRPNFIQKAQLYAQLSTLVFSGFEENNSLTVKGSQNYLLTFPISAVATPLSLLLSSIHSLYLRLLKLGPATLSLSNISNLRHEDVSWNFRYNHSCSTEMFDILLLIR